MAKTPASLVASTRSAIEKMGTVDWLLAIALIVVIVTLVMWIYAHQNGGDIHNTMLEEGFYDRGSRGRANRAEMIELFGSEKPRESQPLPSLKKLDDIDDSELVVLFVHYTDCIHCQNFLPMWQRLCEKYQNVTKNEKTIRLYEVSNSSNEALWSATSDRFGIEGYPTILFLKNKNGKVQHEEYMGPRDEYTVWCRYIERQCVG